MAEPVGDDVYTRGIEAARAALTERARSRPRPRAVPQAEPPLAEDPPARSRPRAVAEPDPVLDVTEAPSDDPETRIAELEAENRQLRAALARIADTTRRALDD